MFAYAVALLMHETLKKCGDDLTRENLMKQAANPQKFRLPLALPGITVSTSPTDYYPIQAVQLPRFQGETWELFGDVMHAESTGPVFPRLLPAMIGRRKRRAAYECAAAPGGTRRCRSGRFLVHIAAREVAVALSHELLQGHDAVFVGVEALEDSSTGGWPGDRRAARCCRPPGCGQTARPG